MVVAMHLYDIFGKNPNTDKFYFFDVVYRFEQKYRTVSFT